MNGEEPLLHGIINKILYKVLSLRGEKYSGSLKEPKTTISYLYNYIKCDLRKIIKKLENKIIVRIRRIRQSILYVCSPALSKKINYNLYVDDKRFHKN